MGLDMFAYVGQRGQRDAFWEQDLQMNQDTREFEAPEGGVQRPREIAYWRKHPNLHGWMERLWHAKRSAENNPVVEDENDIGGSFNGVELELTWEDIEALEVAVKNDSLPPTSGFFFGNNSDELYKEDDLTFIKNAKAELFLGLQVFYNSSW